MNCLTCKFFALIYQVLRGNEEINIYPCELRENDSIEKQFTECRRHAPTMLSGSGTGWSNQLFPRVRPEDWCGEYCEYELLT